VNHPSIFNEEPLVLTTGRAKIFHIDSSYMRIGLKS
jgi:hypothetical protein